MPAIHASLACNLDADLLLASLPLFASEKVQGIEWSFDALYNRKDIPDWFYELIQTFSSEGRLIGHGIFFSLFSGKWSSEQAQWLVHLKKLSQQFSFDQVTEHFGFMTGANFHDGAPLSLPFNTTTLAIGQDRLKRIYQAAACPVGLENLAFAYSLEAVKHHGDFLNQLLEPINGFIILDLHNLFCQLHNFKQSYDDLIDLYPLERVREIHISGGSWEDSLVEPGEKVRRDTHDDRVPEAVYDLLDKTVDRCPNLKYVVLEQMGTALKTTQQRKDFQKDFFRMEKMIAAKNSNRKVNLTNDFQPKSPVITDTIQQNEALFQQQRELSQILENTPDFKTAQQQLAASSLANSDWNTENWEPRMLETVIQIAQKWKGKN